MRVFSAIGNAARAFKGIWAEHAVREQARLAVFQDLSKQGYVALDIPIFPGTEAGLLSPSVATTYERHNADGTKDIVTAGDFENRVTAHLAASATSATPVFNRHLA